MAASLGRAIAGLVNMLNPERVLLGGSFADVLDAARDDVEAALDNYVLDAPGETVLLCKPGLGEDSALLGAAEVAFAELLADPLRGRVLARPLIVAAGSRFTSGAISTGSAMWASAVVTTTALRHADGVRDTAG